MKIYIDEGHNYSGADTGAQGNGLKEQDVTFAVGKLLGKMLEKSGVEVKHSRTELISNVGNGTLSSSINTRCSNANTWKANYFISLHCDSATSVSAKGSHICIYGKGGEAEKLAEAVMPNLLEMRLEGRNQTIQVRTDLGVLKNTNMPAILIEMGFISNADNAKILKDNQRGLATAIYNGIASYLNLPTQIDEPENTVPIYIEGIKESISGLLVGDTTYVPLRPLCEKLKLDVQWNERDKSITVSNRDKKSAVEEVSKPETKAETAESKIENVIPAVVPTKYYIEGITHVIEIDPRNIFNVETQQVTNKIPYNNFVNSVFFMPQGNGIMFSQGMVVNASEVLSNYATHGKPVATLIVRGWNDVELKYVTDITKEKNVWFAVSGYGVYPNITNAEEGFVGEFSDVTRATNRPIIGYRKKDNRIVIAVRSNSDAKRASQTAKNLGLDFAISLDGGGSTTLKVNGVYKFKGDCKRKLWGGIIWN